MGGWKRGGRGKEGGGSHLSWLHGGGERTRTNSDCLDPNGVGVKRMFTTHGETGLI